MNPKQLLADILEHFQQHAAWPFVRVLQARYGPRVNVRAIAAEAGRDLVVCDDGVDAACRLTPKAVAAMPDARADLMHLIRSVRLVGRSYAEKGGEPVSEADFRRELDLDDAATRRLGLLLRLMNGPWNSSGWNSVGSNFHVVPNEDAFFYQDIETYDDVIDVQERLNTDRQRIAQLQSFDWQRTYAGAMRVVSITTGWPKVDRQLLEVRTRLLTANTEEQFQAVGLLCRETLISLCEAVHDPARHPTADGVRASATDVKRRLEAFFATELTGESNAEARSHARAAVSLANALVHMRTADFRAAALCAEATASVVNLGAILERTTA